MGNARFIRIGKEHQVSYLRFVDIVGTVVISGTGKAFYGLAALIKYIIDKAAAVKTARVRPPHLYPVPTKFLATLTSLSTFALGLFSFAGVLGAFPVFPFGLIVSFWPIKIRSDVKLFHFFKLLTVTPYWEAMRDNVSPDFTTYTEEDPVCGLLFPVELEFLFELLFVAVFG